VPLLPAGAALVLLRQPQRQPEDDPGGRHPADGGHRHRRLRRALPGRRRPGGQGRPGRPAIHAAALAGARKVIAVDIDRRKLELARAFGATDTVDSSQVNPVSAIRELTGGFGADVTVEAVGHPEVMKQAFHARDHAGTLVQVGVPNPTMRVDLRMLDFYGRGGALRPSWYGDCLPTRDFPILIDLYLRGRYDLDRFVSETITLDQVEEAFAKMQRNEVLRSVVVFPDA
jgi:S-(hydroxymethyl)mycothiol dehydrogenase